MKKKHCHPLILALVLLIVTAPACGPKPIPREPTVTPTKQPQAVAVVPLEPTVTPTKHPEAIGYLKEELYYVEGMGGGQACYVYWTAVPSNLPAVVGMDDRAGEVPDLCLIGFPLDDEEIAVDLYLPNGDHFSRTFQLPEDYGKDRGIYSHGEVDGVTLISVDLWQPASMPTGEWTAVVSSSSAHAEGSFDVGDDDPQVSTIPADIDVNPFESHACGSYAAGEEVKVLGANFPPDEDFLMGIYYCEDCSEHDFLASLVYSEVVPIDSQGSFSTSIHVGPSDLAGVYLILPVMDPDSDLDCTDPSEYGFFPPGTDACRFLGNIGCFKVP